MLEIVSYGCFLKRADVSSFFVRVCGDMWRAVFIAELCVTINGSDLSSSVKSLLLIVDKRASILNIVSRMACFFCSTAQLYPQVC